jgi:hypothetical protein
MYTQREKQPKTVNLSGQNQQPGKLHRDTTSNQQCDQAYKC